MKKRIIPIILAALMVFTLLAACDGGSGSGDVPEIVFMFWGGLEEKEAMENVAAEFNAKNEGRVVVNAMHVPNVDYPARLATMIAGEEAPDIAYLGSALFPTYAEEGHLYNLSTLFTGANANFLDGVLDDAIWRFGGDVYGFSTAQVNLLITYNEEVFDRHGVEYPPDRYENALSFDQFINLAQRVTIDAGGNNALSSDFNPSQIMTYGINLTTWFSTIHVLAYTNGASLLNADSTDTNFAAPEWADTLYKINRMIYDYHVTPSPADAESLPAEAMLSGSIAMNFDGKWSLLAYAQQDFPLGCAVYPNLGSGPKTMSAPGVTTIFSQSKHPELAWEFFQYKMDVENGATDLYLGGLWQPIQRVWYTDPAKLAFWTDNPAHPPSFQGAVIDMAQRSDSVVRLPTTYIRNWGDVLNHVNPAIQEIFGSKLTLDEISNIMAEVQRNITESGAFGGRFDN